MNLRLVFTEKKKMKLYEIKKINNLLLVKANIDIQHVRLKDRTWHTEGKVSKTISHLTCSFKRPNMAS